MKNAWSESPVCGRSLLLAWAFLVCTVGCSSSSDQSLGEDALDDSSNLPLYQGRFVLKMMSSYPLERNPFLVLVEAQDESGQPFASYQGRVRLAQVVVKDPTGTPDAESYVVAYDEWGNRPEKATGDVGGFVEGRNLLAMTFASVRQKSPYYTIDLRIEDARNPEMYGTLTFTGWVNPPERQEYTEIGRPYDSQPLVPGQPGTFNLVARSGRNSGWELPDLTRGTMEFFTNGPGTVAPGRIEEYSAKADEYGRLQTEFSFSQPGQHFLSAIWLNLAGMVRSSHGGPFQVSPPTRTLTFVKAELNELSGVADLWASPWGTYAAFEFGKLYRTTDGANSWELVHEFETGLAGVGARESYDLTSYGVCVITGSSIRCDCLTDCMGWQFDFGSAYQNICLPGHPNKNLRCQVNPQLTYMRDIELTPSWGGVTYHGTLFTSGDFPETGYSNHEEGNCPTSPGLTFPWALAEDRVFRTVYWADRTTPQIRYTMDGGVTWGRIQSNLPADDGITSLAFDEKFRLLYAGTDASGLWVTSLDSVEE